MSIIDMKKYGLVKSFISESFLSDNQKIGRIISRDNENYKVVTECGIATAEISDRFKFNANSLLEYPVVGDFVIVEVNQDGFNSTIFEILKRKNVLTRKGEWDVNYDHITAANIDTIFICLSLNNDFNIQKLKAYISIALSCNAEPVVILSECDSFLNIDSILSDVRNETKGMEVIVTSAMDRDNCKSVKNYITEGKTAVFIGPEHDKVKIVNKVLGDVCFEHNLLLLKGGGIIINTPEMRELGIESINITKNLQIL